MKRHRSKKVDSWLVEIRCVVTKELVVEGCTEEEARTVPFDFCEDEIEIEQIDWEVKRVRPNN